MSIDNTLNINGEQSISIMKSWLAWRKLTRRNNFLDLKLHLNDQGYCMDCDNRGQINEKSFGLIRCICSLKDYEEYLKEDLKMYEGAWMPHTFDEYRLWGNSADHSAIKYIKKEVQAWVDNPKQWIMFGGNVGTGKSMLMHIINTTLTPWSMYMSMPDLEQSIFNAIGDPNDENALNMLLYRIARHPILLIDDIGSDYGSRFIKSAVQKILDYRYRFYSEFPTVVSTNLGGNQLIGYDTRIADRITDKQRNLIFAFPMTKSFRQEGNAI